MADDNTLGLFIDGKEYTVEPEDLELGEVEIIEDLCDAPLEEIDFRRARAIRALAYVMRHRTDKSFTLEKASHLKLSALGQPEQNGNGNGKRPTKAAKAAGS